MSARCSAVAAATAAAAAVLCVASELLERSHQRRSATKVQLCFVARLEPTRMRWKSDETDVQEFHSAKSTCNSTLTLSLGWLCAQADYA